MKRLGAVDVLNIERFVFLSEAKDFGFCRRTARSFAPLRFAQDDRAAFVRIANRAKRLLLIAIAAFATAQYGLAATASSATPAQSPVLIELFTSEGCSSCPPADKALQHMDEAQPMPGVQIIVLSEHITYFNHEGWTDPYSKQQLTDRQYAYAHVLGLSDVFTPQMLVDGTQELWGKTSRQAEGLIRQVAGAAAVPIHIRSVALDPQGFLRAQIEVDGAQERHNADIYAAVALDHATVDVPRGENRGQQLTHVAVVQVLKKVGKLKKGATLNTAIAVKLTPEIAKENLRLIIFAQEPGPGKIDGAAMEKGIGRGPVS